MGFQVEKWMWFILSKMAVLWYLGERYDKMREPAAPLIP
jgi:hypothetical protein